jgi:hypothetical protein
MKESNRTYSFRKPRFETLRIGGKSEKVVMHTTSLDFSYAEKNKNPVVFTRSLISKLIIHIHRRKRGKSESRINSVLLKNLVLSLLATKNRNRKHGISYQLSPQ